MSTELNALASGSQATSASNYANQSNLDIYVDIEVFLNTLSTTASVGAYVALYVLESIDGTNFPAQSTTDLRLTTTQLLCVIPTGITASSTQRVVARNIILPPGLFSLVFDNQIGIALAATLNTVRFLPYNYNLNG